MVPHAGVVNLLLGAKQRYSSVKGSTFGVPTPYVFDVSIYNIFSSFAVLGGCCKLLRDGASLVMLSDADGLTHLAAVPSILAVARVPLSVRQVQVGGEALTQAAVQSVHAAASCSDCHTPTRHPEENGRSWKRAAGKQCSACHESPHAGQFLRSGNTDCRRCHRSAEAFSELAFDHDRDARFELGEAHGDLACSACHETVDLETGQEVVRYRPMKRECVDCHGVHEEPLRRRRGGK